MPHQQNVPQRAATALVGGLPVILAHPGQGAIPAGIAARWHHVAPIAATRPTGRTSSLAAWQERRIRLHVEAHLEETLRLDDVARLAGLSRSHFSRCFRNSFGVSFVRFVAGRRVARAAQLLLAGEQALSEIALVCGFADQSHFTRVFGQVTGESPMAWRRARAPGRA